MTVFSMELAPVFHREGTPLALATGGIALMAAAAAIAVMTARDRPEWRRAWLLAAGLCLLLAVDEALPLDHWVARLTGLHWWLVYLLPVIVGVWGWLRAMDLLDEELPWYSGPVRLLHRGTLCWVVAFAARGFAFLNEHGPRVHLTGIPLVAEAVFKLAGALIWSIALTQIFIRIRSSQTARTRGQTPFMGQQLPSKQVALAQGGSDPDDEAQEWERAFPERKRLSPQRGRHSPRDAHQEV